MSDLVVRPVRFTDNLDAMRAFLETLGLKRRVESQSGGWVDMVAGGEPAALGGMVALHSASEAARPASSGFTSLSFEADDIAVLASRLEAAGVPDVTVYDEAYGRVLTCRDPLGDEITVDERSTDLYGYRLNAADGAAPGWQVMAIRFTDPTGDYGTFLRALGMEPRGDASEHFAAYVFPDDRCGAVGLHPPTDDAGAWTHEPGVARLSFETIEPLGDVAVRLSAQGFAPEQRDEAFGPVLAVVDSDGISVEVFRAPQAAA